MFIYVFLVTVFFPKQSLTEEVLTDLDNTGLESSLQSPLLAVRRLSGSSQQAFRRLSAQESLRKLSGSSQETLRKLSASSQETLSSGISQKALRKLSGDFQEALRRLSALGINTIRHVYIRISCNSFYEMSIFSQSWFLRLSIIVFKVIV